MDDQLTRNIAKEVGGMKMHQESLPRPEGIVRWAAAASTAGALLPRKIADNILSLDWEATGRDRVDMYDIVESIADAVREVQEDHLEDCGGTYAPCPRGVDVHCSPTGGVDVVWESDSHTTTLRFVAESRDSANRIGGFSAHGSGLVPDYVILLCCAEVEDSARLRACRGE